MLISRLNGDSCCKPQWYHYFLCGIKGILDVLPTETNIKGLSVIVSGNIPPSAGLSSSSALVSAAALAASYAFNVSSLHRLSLILQRVWTYNFFL